MASRRTLGFDFDLASQQLSSGGFGSAGISPALIDPVYVKFDARATQIDPNAHGLRNISAAIPNPVEDKTWEMGMRFTAAAVDAAMRFRDSIDSTSAQYASMEYLSDIRSKLQEYTSLTSKDAVEQSEAFQNSIRQYRLSTLQSMKPAVAAKAIESIHNVTEQASQQGAAHMIKQKAVWEHEVAEMALNINMRAMTNVPNIDKYNENLAKGLQHIKDVPSLSDEAKLTAQGQYLDDMTSVGVAQALTRGDFTLAQSIYNRGLEIGISADTNTKMLSAFQSYIESLQASNRVASASERQELKWRQDDLERQTWATAIKHADAFNTKKDADIFANEAVAQGLDAEAAYKIASYMLDSRQKLTEVEEAQVDAIYSSAIRLPQEERGAYIQKQDASTPVKARAMRRLYETIGSDAKKQLSLAGAKEALATNYSWLTEILDANPSMKNAFAEVLAKFGSIQNDEFAEIFRRYGQDVKAVASSRGVFSAAMPITQLVDFVNSSSTDAAENFFTLLGEGIGLDAELVRNIVAVATKKTSNSEIAKAAFGEFATRVLERGEPAMASALRSDMERIQMLLILARYQERARNIDPENMKVRARQEKELTKKERRIQQIIQNTEDVDIDAPEEEFTARLQRLGDGGL